MSCRRKERRWISPGDQGVEAAGSPQISCGEPADGLSPLEGTPGLRNQVVVWARRRAGLESHSMWLPLAPDSATDPASLGTWGNPPMATSESRAPKFSMDYPQRAWGGEEGWDAGEWRTSSFLFPGCLHGPAQPQAEPGRVSTRETETMKSAILLLSPHLHPIHPHPTSSPQIIRRELVEQPTSYIPRHPWTPHPTPRSSPRPPTRPPLSDVEAQQGDRKGGERYALTFVTHRAN